jgi:hypothetical protein
LGPAPELDAHVADLQTHGYRIEVVQEGPRLYLLFRDFPLGPHFVPQTSDLMVFTTVDYPIAGFDMFWVSDNVKLASGSVPKAAESVEPYLGRQWRRFSWHLNRPWNPSRDSLHSWVTHVEERLHRGE